MTSQPAQETRIDADPQLPTIRITREFAAPPAKVFHAWTDPDLVTQWLGPKSLTMKIDSWDMRTGGSYRYRAIREGQVVASFYGSFHEVRPNGRLVQTFTFEGVPDGVSLDTATFEDLGDGRTRVTILSVVDSLVARDAILASGMDQGVTEGYERLDALLTTFA
ncbi:SRPBCC family protein [Streptantibioticus ferralitis]|uniref:SRPBCC family protein n=1 Tax=Streptantibioticus ferralitis TaxID=236510 RepID=A0ABT5Z1D2_9ACTN|nr:SRPBCC family protein [Streptantibioticus ferralitis]MDF2257578.1 SRPBCC family protein [Streptantibioticus ferralitis]